MSKDQNITIKLVKSGIGRMKNHKLCIKGLGFKKLNQVVTVVDTPSVTIFLFFLPFAAIIILALAF